MARIIPTGPDTFQYVEDDTPIVQYQQPTSVQQQAQQRASNYRIPPGSYVQRMTGPDTFDVLEYGDNPGAQIVWVGADYGGEAKPTKQQPSAQEWRPAARAPSSQYLGISWRPSGPGGTEQTVPYATVSPPGVSGAVPGQYQTPRTAVTVSPPSATDTVPGQYQTPRPVITNPQEIEDITGQTVLGISESVQLVDSNGALHDVKAKIDTGAWRSALDKNLAQKLGLNKAIDYGRVRGALGRQEREIIDLTMHLRDHKIKTKAYTVDRSHMKYPMIIGRRDLSGFLVDPSQN